MLLDTGAVFCWGAGRKGQLGFLQNGKVPGNVATPTEGNVISVTFLDYQGRGGGGL